MSVSPLLPIGAPLLTSLATIASTLGVDDQTAYDSEDPYRLTNEYIPLQVLDFPDRPKPILEFGNPFLAPGSLQDGFTLPTGAVWTPSFLVWGSLRSGASAIDRDFREDAEWVNRLDVFGELRLSPTERLVAALRPLDKNGEFTGIDDSGDDPDGTNLDIQTLFFEGDFGEIFPGLDRRDSRALDIGFGLGRQPLNFQDGILINDRLDAITITRNSIRFAGISNLRATAIFSFDNIDHGVIEDEDALLFGLLTETDLEKTFLEIDAVAVLSDNPLFGDGLFFGVGATQRIGLMNSTFRVNGSLALDDAVTPAGFPGSVGLLDDGMLLTSVLSWVPHHTEDNLYFGSFLGIGSYSSAAREAPAGGPVANTGILFAATGLGSVGSPISNEAGSAVGAALGYQQFFRHGRSQMIYEVARSRPDRQSRSARPARRHHARRRRSLPSGLRSPHGHDRGRVRRSRPGRRGLRRRAARVPVEVLKGRRSS